MSASAGRASLGPVPDIPRPTLHFSCSTWMNDPNGLLFHDGTWHLFFQTNPDGPDWGNLSWGHATSTDLVHWEERPVALRVEPGELVFSGSAVADTANTAGFAGPGETALVAIYTSHHVPPSPRSGTQTQSLAYSLDGGTTWTRYPGNPVLDLGMQDFRDPKVFWWEGGGAGHWVMATVDPPGRRVLLHTSPNLRDWTAASTFAPADPPGGIWECPDLFPLEADGETHWVLVVSVNPGGVAGGSGAAYVVGDFDGTTFTATGDFGWLDFGRDHYAPVSFSGVPEGRRLMVGWASNWDYAAAAPPTSWRSAMSFVREIGLVADDGVPRVVQRPVVPLDDPALAVAELTAPVVPGRVTDVVVSTADGAARVVVTVDGDRRELRLDRHRSGVVDFHPAFPSVDVAPLPPGDEVDLTVIADGSLVEVFAAGGRVTMVAQVFPLAPLTEVHVVEQRTS